MFNNRYALAVCQKKMPTNKQQAVSSLPMPALAHSWRFIMALNLCLAFVASVTVLALQKIVMLSSRYRLIFIIITTIIINVHLNKLFKILKKFS